MKVDSLSLTVTEGDDAELTEACEMNCHATNIVSRRSTTYKCQALTWSKHL